MLSGDDDWTTRDWQAWIDLMPGKNPTLHVSGIVECPTSDYSAELQVHNPPGVNPKDLLLDLVVTEPAGPVREVVTDVPVDFSKPASKGEYDTVSVIGAESGIPVKSTNGETA